MKKAVVYDKWLSTLGGGEMVACSFVQFLLNKNYEVTFVCGKKVPLEVIKNKLGFDLKGVKFVEIWNDEIALKNITKDKDLFFNVTFMDYMVGAAKKNIYYVYFPTESGSNARNIFINKWLLPLAKKIISVHEFIHGPSQIISKDGRCLYQLNDQPTTMAFFNLQPATEYRLKFKIFFESFCKTALNDFNFTLKNGQILTKTITCDHQRNIINFDLILKSKSETIYVDWQQKNGYPAFVINPSLIKNRLLNTITSGLQEKFSNRLRAGVFSSIPARMTEYDLVLADSEFAAEWVQNYWALKAQVLYPTVELFFEKHAINKLNKKNYLTSVGRFFTLGHGKKQEVMIEAFKQLYDQGLTDWELHLAGGLGDEPTSQAFMAELKKQSQGYPIYFHINCARSEIEKLLLASKIYWHAAGFGEDARRQPIKFEHFGIAPIEAISAGCIPILYRGGGLTETVQKLSLSDLHLFKNTPELIDHTTKIINNYDQEAVFLNKQLQKTMLENYSLPNIEKNFWRLIDSVK